MALEPRRLAQATPALVALRSLAGHDRAAPRARIPLLGCLPTSKDSTGNAPGALGKHAEATKACGVGESVSFRPIGQQLLPSSCQSPAPRDCHGDLLGLSSGRVLYPALHQCGPDNMARPAWAYKYKY